MSEKAKEPVIRFKGFTEEWEEKKLGEIADVTKLAGFEFTEHIVYSDEGNIIALRGLNIKNGQLILDDVKYIDGSNFSKLNRSKLYVNDIMFTYVGTIGEVAIIKENDRFYLAPNVSRIRIESGDSPEYISQYMRTEQFYRTVIFPLIATSSQPALSMENIRKFAIYLPPNMQEQQKIGSYFRQLDRLITLYQRKYNKLTSVKKSMLQKMFPQNAQTVPQIRFKGFTEPWEQRKLGEIAIICKGQQINKAKLGSSGKYYVLNGGMTASGYTDNFNTNADTISISEGGNSCGFVNYNFEPFWSGGHNYTLINPKINRRYLYQMLKFIEPQIMALRVGSGLPNIQKNRLEEVNILFPSDLEEQQKIGSYFRQLDHLIALCQQELQKLQNLKKACLKKMFV